MLRGFVVIAVETALADFVAAAEGNSTVVVDNRLAVAVGKSVVVDNRLGAVVGNSVAAAAAVVELVVAYQIVQPFSDYSMLRCE